MKNQFKKSLSLIMAVLMLMSCWVWVAPEKANAYLDVQYSMTIIYDVENTAKNGGHVEIYYYPFNDDGTLSSTRTKFADSGNVLSGGLFTEGNGTNNCTKTVSGIPGWPCEIFWKVNGASADDYNVLLKEVKIGSVTVAKSSTWVDDGGTKDQTRSFTWKWDGTGGSDNMVSSRNWSKPAFKEISSVTTTDAGTLKKLPNGADVTTTAKVDGGKDQYGVALPAGSFPKNGFSYSIVDANGTAVSSTYASATGSGTTATITIKDDAQKLFPEANGGTLYLKATYGSHSVSKGFKFDNPEYTATFYANGGKIGIDDSESVDTVTIGGTDSKKYYNTVIGKSPANRTKPGFTFVGFYDKEMLDINGRNIEYKDKAGNTVSNPVLFVDSGDNATRVPETGDTKWYALWQSSPITATFMTADNQLIGTVEGRYNNYLTASNMYGSLSALNDKVKASYTGDKEKMFGSGNTPIYKDGSSEFKFDGWRIIKAYSDSVVDGDETTVLQGDVTFQATYVKASSATYTVKFKNAEGNVISTKSGYKYRDEVTNIPAPADEPTKAQDDKYAYEFIGWAKDIGVNSYAVDAEDKAEDGARISYTHKDGAEFVVRGDISYVPVFRMVPREYSVTYNYTLDGGVESTEPAVIGGYHWLDTPRMPEIKDNYTNAGYRLYLIGWYVGDDKTTVKQLDEITVDGDITLTAVYGNEEAAKYTINFYGKSEEDGETDVLLNEGENIYEHDDPVTAPDVPQIIETADARYTFAGWSADIKSPAGSDADYYATYTKNIYADLQFFNYDGSALTEVIKGNFEGDIIPAYGNEDPVKPDDMTGTYVFKGWNTELDGTGTDVVFGETKFAGDTNLYAQYDTVYKEYTVTFLDDVLDADGKNVVVSQEKYHYGEDIEIPAAPTKSKDDTYSYKFRAWSPDVSDICYGDATYTAVYDREFNFYKVTWLDDTKKVHAESNYKFNAKIQPGVIKNPVGYSAPETGKEWALDYWVQCDANGNPVDADGNIVEKENAATFVYGQKMPAKALYFYPVFKQVENQILVTFYKDKEKTSYLGEMKIPYGKSIKEFDADIKALAHKESDETHHFEITAWKNAETDAAVTTVLENVSVYAEYTQEAHSMGEIKIIVEPTCTEAGVANFDCALDDCDYVFRNVTLDVIPDEAAPGGQLYVGENKWTLDDYNADIDYSDVKYVGPQTMVIVNAEDVGSRSKNNPDAILHRGVGKVDYYVSTVEIDPSGISNWNNIYDYELIADQVLKQVLEAKGKTMQDYIAMSTPGNKDKKMIDSEVKEILATYNANATGSLSNLNLVNGSEYIIYLRISDRKVNGSSNVSYLSSGKIHYGSTAATVTVSGDGFGTKFCADATIKVTDDTDGFTVKLDGEEITLNADGEYKCEAKGVHTVTVVDKHGNITTKTFEVKGNHTNRQYVINATCENEGSRYNICTVCGAKTNVEVLPAIGHSYTANLVDKAPTCVVDGYRTYVCDNNCGTKLVLDPDDNAEKIALAKKFVEPAEGEEEGTWVALTAKDIEHLKATGNHTYPYVKDENGEDTAELAWIIDKASTCSVEGSKHIDCTVCGHIDARRVESIPVDTVNGHKFYREKVISEPLCQEIGKKAKTCRYCGYVETTEYIPALGHVAGEYVTLVEPTCTTVGSEMRTCSRCDCYIGEGEYDPMKEPVAKEIPALGHAWKVEGKPTKMDKLDADGNVVTDENGEVVQAWYQKYVCANDNTHVKYEELEDYVEPVAATVTFKNGEDNVKVINGYVGNVITAAQVTEKPEKDADATYTYTFKGWATKNADGTYTEVKFPIEVKGDATYYAVYTEKFVNYTITYYKEDGTTEFKKTGYLHNGDKVDLADGPSKAETNRVEYKFAGWIVIGSSPEVVLTEEATIAGANINLKAKYTSVPKKYAVTYAYSKSDILETFEVEAGTEARACAITPVKKADSKNHYEFKAWNKADQLAVVESNIYTTPDFEPIGHTYTHEGGIVTKSPATCDSNRIDTYTCTCGYTFDKEIPGTKREHVWGDRIVGADGSVTKECTYEDCDAVDSKVETFTAKFFVNEGDEKAIKTVSHIAWGTKIEAIQLPATPSKEADETNTYTFKGWAFKGTTDVVDVTAIEIKADYEFVAIFTPTIREYNVIFAYDAYNTIKTYTGVKAGSSVTFDGAKPTKVCDETKHYTFSGWIGYSGTEHNITITNIQSDLYILADFAGTKHKYTEKELSAATCTNGTGTRYWCDCNGNGEFDAKVNDAFVDHYEDKTGKPLPHNFEETKRVPATQHADGYVEYTCTVCKTVEKETLKYVDNVIDIKVTITVNGAAKSGIQVEIQPKDGVPFFATTNANGVASAEGTKGVSYTAYATIDGEKVQVTLKEDANGNITGSYNHEDKDVDCSCACHRNNVWGSIFRFFHKIIKLFTGKFKCCGNPDPMYG